MKIINRLTLLLFLVLGNYYVFAQCADSTNIYSFVFDGKTYEVVKENKNWMEAVSCAVERGGILAEINSVEEQNGIFSQLSNAAIINNSTVAPDGGGGAYIWLGANDLSTEGNWVWDGNNDGIDSQFWLGTASGNPVGGLYNNWGNEPDDFLGQDALGLSLNGWPLGVAGQWNDVNHQNILYYLIEYPATDCSNSSSSITDTACVSYTSPSGSYIWTTTNTYIDTIPNAANCDSIITINLTINNVSDLTTSTDGATITSNNTDATYQWLNCDSNYTVIDAQMDVSFTATVNGSYAVQLTENECVDTTECININISGLIENNFGDQFLLYPNPSSENFSVDLGESFQTVTITIVDIVGKQIVRQKYNDSKLLNVKLEEPAGIYFIMIESEDKKAVIRLEKK